MEFVLVGSLLTALVLAVLQLALAMYVHNIAHDAAAEGAHYAALADVDPREGAERTRRMLAQGVGESYAGDVTAELDTRGLVPVVIVRVRTTLPLIGLLGIPSGWEVTADAPRETLGDR